MRSGLFFHILCAKGGITVVMVILVLLKIFSAKGIYWRFSIEDPQAAINVPKHTFVMNSRWAPFYKVYVDKVF